MYLLYIGKRDGRFGRWEGIDLLTHVSVCSYLRLYDDICVRGSPPEVSLLADVGGEGGGGVADAVHALRARAVVVELLPVVVQHHRALDVDLCSAPSVPQPVVQSRRRPLLGPSPD